MAKNVGSIELTVEANTGKLIAQVTKGAKKAGDSGAKALSEGLADLDTGPIVAQLRFLKARAEEILEDTGLEIDLNDTKARAQLEALVAKAELEKIKLDLDIPIEELEAQLEVALRKRQLEVEVELDQERLRAQAEELEQESITWTLELEDRLATNQIRELRAKIEAKNVEIGVDLDLDSASATQLRLYLELLEAREIEIGVKVDLDEASLAAAKAKLEAASKDFDGFGNGLQARTKAIALAVVGLLEPAFVALEGLASAATALIGNAFNALASGLGALAPSLVGLAATLGAVVIGSQGVGTAFGEVTEQWTAAQAAGEKLDTTSSAFRKTLDGLTPSARRVVIAFGDMTDELSAAQDSIQERLFAGLGDEIADLGDKIPDVTAGFGLLADSANDFAKDFIGVLQDIDFTGLFVALKPAVDGVLDGVINLTSTLEPFLLAAAPAAERLAGWFADATGNLENLVRADTGQIDRFLQEGIDSLQNWTELLFAVGGLLGTIFGAGQVEADGYLTSLTAVVTQFDDWLNTLEGSTALTGFFEGGTSALSAFAPVLEGLRQAFEILVTPESIGRFQALGEQLGAAVVKVAELFAVIGEAEIFTVLLAGLESVIDAVLVFEVPLRLVAELIAAIPGPAVAAGIAFFGVANQLVKLNAAVGLLSKSFSITNPQLFAIAAAAGLAVAAFGVLGDKSSDVEERTEELGKTLRTTNEALRSQATAADASSVSLRALEESLTVAGGGGDDLVDALVRTKLSADDALETLTALQDDPVRALTRVAEGMGITGDEAEKLAKIVNNTDDNFGRLTNELLDLADNSQYSREQVRQFAEDLEFLQDQSENTDLNETIKAAIEQEVVYSDAARAALEHAEAITEGGLAADDLIPLYAAFTSKLIELEAAELAAAEAATIAAERQKVAMNAEKDRQAVVDANAAARAAYTQDIRNLEAAYSQLGPATAASIQGFVELAGAANASATAAQGVAAAFDLLVGPSLSADAAIDAVWAGFQELNEAFAAGGEAQLEFGGGLSELTEKGRENRAAVRSQVEALLSYTETQLGVGTSAAEVAANVEQLRAGLVTAAGQFTATEAEAEAYINQLGLTPDLISTVIQLPGVAAAIASGEGLLEAIKNIPEETYATLEVDAQKAIDDLRGVAETTAGIDGSKANGEVTVDTEQEKVDEFQDALDKADSTVVTPRFQFEGLEDGLTDVSQLQKLLDEVHRTKPTPEFTFPGLDDGITDTGTLTSALNDVPDVSVSITILPGLAGQISEVQRLDSAINGLNNKSVTITTINRNLAASMTGRIVNGPMVSTLGERGYREAVIPLELPLNRVDPSVRDMAAQLRGEGGMPGPGGPSVVKTQNNTFNITDSTGNPEATARRVLSRIAAGI